MIQFFSKLFKRNKKHSNKPIEIVVKENINNAKIESYNRLRDNILFLNTDGATNVIQIESSVANEGKTTIACNLAVALGLVNKKVCLVDLDFRKATLNRVFKITNEVGIAEYTLGASTKEEIIKKTVYKNVDLITRGGAIYNSSVVLLSEKFKDLIRQLKKEYDYVILDCPPVLLFSDHIHISQISDGVLFVVAFSSTTKTQVADAVETLKRNNAKILGTVLSQYDIKKDKKNKHYYSKYY